MPALDPVPYDTLIVAGGSRYSYFGHDEWSADAAEVKSLESALTVRSDILAAFEAAEIERDPERRARVADVRGGRRRPDRRRDGRPDRRARPRHAARRLPHRRSEQRPHPARRGRRSRAHRRSRRRCRRRPRTRCASSASRRCSAAPSSTSTSTASPSSRPDGGTRRIPARTVVWAAGVTASEPRLGAGRAHRAEQDRAGRVTVEPDLTLPGHPEVFALGDMVRVRGDDGSAIDPPGVAPVAMQQGRYAASAVRARLRGPRRAAVPLSRQGQPGHDRPSRGRRGHQRHQAQRLPRVGHLAGGASLLPGGLPEPPSRVHPLGVQLRDARPRRAAHHGHSSAGRSVA